MSDTASKMHQGASSCLSLKGGRGKSTPSSRTPPHKVVNLRHTSSTENGGACSQNPDHRSAHARNYVSKRRPKVLLIAFFTIFIQAAIAMRRRGERRGGSGAEKLARAQSRSTGRIIVSKRTLKRRHAKTLNEFTVEFTVTDKNCRKVICKKQYKLKLDEETKEYLTHGGEYPRINKLKAYRIDIGKKHKELWKALGCNVRLMIHKPEHGHAWQCGFRYKTKKTMTIQNGVHVVNGEPKPKLEERHYNDVLLDGTHHIIKKTTFRLPTGQTLPNGNRVEIRYILDERKDLEWVPKLAESDE